MRVSIATGPQKLIGLDFELMHLSIANHGAPSAFARSARAGQSREVSAALYAVQFFVLYWIFGPLSSRMPRGYQRNGDGLCNKARYHHEGACLLILSPFAVS